MEHPITKWRQQEALTQREFAERIGASKSMVSKWEACRALPRPKYMKKIDELTVGAVTPGDIICSFNESSLEDTAQPQGRPPVADHSAPRPERSGESRDSARAEREAAE